MTDEYDLQRFVRAQDRDGTYDAALAELRHGRKTTHWMWFVFPQIGGLGRSEMSRTYALAGVDEARAYLAHPLLGPRLLECCAALPGLATSDATVVLDADAQKLQSSMTLFELAAPANETFAQVLEKFFGGARDSATLGLINS